MGYWHQISFPRVPSGRFDYALIFESPEIYGDGEGRTLIGDKRDIGRWVARIIRDGRTLNRKVVAWSDEVCQKEIVGVVEGKTGERVEMKRVSSPFFRIFIFAHMTWGRLIFTDCTHRPPKNRSNLPSLVRTRN